MAKTYEFKDDKEYIAFLEWQTIRNSQDVQAHLDTIDGKIKDLYFKIDLIVSQPSDIGDPIDIKDVSNLSTELSNIIARLNWLEARNTMIMSMKEDIKEG